MDIHARHCEGCGESDRSYRLLIARSYLFDGVPVSDLLPSRLAAIFTVMSEDEFTERFAARICELAALEGKPFGKEPEVYASEIAGTYWRERFPEGIGPEACAEEDAAYW
ncbi:hypothetical protein [Neorhizobium sp. DT-125]|uniref:hypothetical protein n=1 Tax=Neorhizobium sp. DT-125 TaxID=3396163 RepID=UPI003F1C6361